MRVISIIFGVLIVSFLASCKSMNINSAQPIMIPSGLSVQHVKFAILKSITPDDKAEKITNYQKITDRALKARFGFMYKGLNNANQWFVEDVTENSVIAGFNKGNHYFRVEYVIKNSQIYQNIVGSKNLNQTDETIHKAVFVWLHNMEVNIRSNMGAIVPLVK